MSFGQHVLHVLAWVLPVVVVFALVDWWVGKK